MSTMIAIRATVSKNNLQVEDGNLQEKLALFPDGTEVIIISRRDWNIIAGSDSVRFQLEKANAEIERLNTLISTSQTSENEGSV